MRCKAMVLGVVAAAAVTAIAPPAGEAGPPPDLSSFHVSISPTASTIPFGTNLKLTLTLDKPAPAVMPVTLSTAGPIGVVSCPSLAKIPAGKTKASFKVNGLGPGGPVAVTATLPAAAGGASATAQVTVTGISISLTPAALTVPVGSAAQLTVALDKPAPVGGADITFSASGPQGVIAIPSAVSIPTGSSVFQMTVKGLSPGGPVTVTATLEASLGGAHDSASVSVVTFTRSPSKRR